MKVDRGAFGGDICASATTSDRMMRLRDAALLYANLISEHVPEGVDQVYILRKLREVAMWTTVAILRNADGTVRVESD